MLQSKVEKGLQKKKQMKNMSGAAHWYVQNTLENIPNHVPLVLDAQNDADALYSPQAYGPGAKGWRRETKEQREACLGLLPGMNGDMAGGLAGEASGLWCQAIPDCESQTKKGAQHKTSIVTVWGRYQ